MMMIIITLSHVHSRSFSNRYIDVAAIDYDDDDDDGDDDDTWKKMMIH